MRTRPSLSVPFCCTALVLLAASGSPADPDPINARYSSLAAGTGAFDWEGGAERTDFVQWSDGLGQWHYLPVIKYGEAPNSIGIDSDSPAFFLRVYHTDVAIPPGLTHETADFDGDGLTNLFEVLNGLDPMETSLVPDTDEDGLNDVHEQAAGTAPNVMDHPAVRLSVCEVGG